MPRERKYEVVDNSAQVQALVEKVAERGFTPLQEHFGNWVVDQAGIEYKTKKEEDAARFAAKMALVLRMEHQKSPENHAFKAELAEARAAEEDARPKRQPKAAAEETPAPARRGRKAAAPVDELEEAPAPKRRGRPAKAAAAETAEPKTEAKVSASRPARRPAASARPGRPARSAKTAEAEF